MYFGETHFFSDNDTAVAGIGGIDQYTKLMLHMDGANGSTTFTDSSTAQAAKTVTAVAGAQITTTDPKFGTGAGLFDGTGDYLTIADTNDVNFSTGDFTIDGWINHASFVGSPMFFCQGIGGGSTWIYFQIGAVNITISIFIGGVQKLNLAAAHGISTGSWNHFSIVGGWGGTPGNVSFTVNGVSKAEGSITGGAAPDCSGVFAIGAADDGTQTLNGKIDEFRISKGIARWTTNFTPPAVPYTT